MALVFDSVVDRDASLNNGGIESYYKRYAVYNTHYLHSHFALNHYPSRISSLTGFPGVGKHRVGSNNCALQ